MSVGRISLIYVRNRYASNTTGEYWKTFIVDTVELTTVKLIPYPITDTDAQRKDVELSSIIVNCLKSDCRYRICLYTRTIISIFRSILSND